MTIPAHPIKEQAETALTDARFDFIAKYHAVTDLRRLAAGRPGLLDGRTIGALKTLLRSGAFRRQRQSYVLFREAASVMTDMAAGPEGNAWGKEALAALKGLLRDIEGSAHRGVAEALGGLPAGVLRRRPAVDGCPPPATVSWPRLLSDHRLIPSGPPRYIGRSLVIPVSGDNRLLVVKLARHGDQAKDLANEIYWLQTLRHPSWFAGCRFQVPLPLSVDGRPVMRLNGLPLPPPAGVDRHARGWGIAFVAHRDYFVYPNQLRIDGGAAREILGRSAFLLGWLAARGVIHEAPIPLFHNRTQRMRREDQGRYQWFRSGRLDQWLESCRYPNFGLSGLRDLEHLVPFDGDGRTLYRHVGSHLLSLLLVAGSHFRCRDTTRVGLDPQGNPVDVRDLFERPLLKTIIRHIFDRYREGFTGDRAATPLPVDLEGLADRMIEEMGVDRHMTEWLRRADQLHMTDAAFVDFLHQRGYGLEACRKMTRGEKDILIASGPHLGDFNRQISLPELITAVAAMSATCIADRFMVVRRSGATTT